MSETNNRVFVVFGRDLAPKSAMHAFLRAIGIEPIEFDAARSMTGSASPYVGEIVDTAFNCAQAIIVLLTPDEVAYLRSGLGSAGDPETNPSYQPRPNVLFEAGLAFGRHPERTVLVEVGGIRAFSDVAGRYTVRIGDSPEWRHDLVQRLKDAGCEPNTSGKDWLSTPDIALPDLSGLPLGKRHPESDNSLPRLSAQYSKQGNSGRVRLTNHGGVDLFEVVLTVPPEGRDGFSLIQEKPIARLPAGKTATLMAFRNFGHGDDQFDLQIDAKLDSGESVTTSAYIDLLDS